MATGKKNIYTEMDLEWAESKLLEWKAYVNSNPFDRMKDRITMKTTKAGAMPIVVATVESQIKCVRDTMKDYLSLLSEVDKMRTVEEHKKKESKGDTEIPARMR